MEIDDPCGMFSSGTTTDDKEVDNKKNVNDDKNLKDKKKKEQQAKENDKKEKKNDERIDPFIKYAKDGYKFPDLYTETMEMLQSNLIIYPLVDLRAIARKEQQEKQENGTPTPTPTPTTPTPTPTTTGKNNDTDNNSSKNKKENKKNNKNGIKTKRSPSVDSESDISCQSGYSYKSDSPSSLFSSFFSSTEKKAPISKALQLPMKRKDMVRLIGQNSEKLESKNGVKHHNLLDKQINNKNSVVSSTTIIAVDDQFAKRELVYTIEVNKKRKCIIVCFRGSITKTDWATDFEIYMKEVTNPIAHHPNQESTIKIHNGFHDYLFEPNSRGVKGPNGEDLSEYQEILQQHVIPVLKKYPGFKLYVTGHSSGGALATLFGYEAAAEPDDVIPKPVSIFSFASPYVGDESFRSSHQLLESLGKLRHCRISNQQDLITTVPKMSFRFNIFADHPSPHVGTLFKHVGMNLRLLDSTTTPLELSYPVVYSPSKGGWFHSAMDEFCRGWNQTIFMNFSWNPLEYFNWSWHSLVEHESRLQTNHAVLNTLHLNDLYGRKDLVGHLVPQF